MVVSPWCHLLSVRCCGWGLQVLIREVNGVVGTICPKWWGAQRRCAIQVGARLLRRGRRYCSCCVLLLLLWDGVGWPSTNFVLSVPSRLEARCGRLQHGYRPTGVRGGCVPRKTGPAVASRCCSWLPGGVGAAGSLAGVAAFPSKPVISGVPRGAARAGATHWDAGETRDFSPLGRVQRIELC